MKLVLMTTALVTAVNAETTLTIYNRNLAVVRETIPLQLKQGVNEISFDRATAQVLPDSVVLRDPAGKVGFSVLEQSYRNDPVNKWLLLSHFEGETIEFRSTYPDGKVEVKPGRIIRSGHVPGGQPQDPIIEVDGKLRFVLPGEPLFPTLGDGSILRPTLGWQIQSEADASFDAQLSYLSNGFHWEADYNLVAPEKGETVTITGWVTVNNLSGTGFEQAKVKLVAGDVNIIELPSLGAPAPVTRKMEAFADAAKVQEKAFDDFHLYTLPRPLTIRDKETKQVEFLRASEVKASKKYVYDVVSFRNYDGRPQTQQLEGQSFPKDVAIYWEFRNDEANGLGVPLPAGRVRFYRSDDEDGNLEFVGENDIGHTPRNENVSLYTGNAFDLVGERKITHFQRDDRAQWMKESVEVTVKNRSKEPKEIIVRERLWRWMNWKLEDASAEYVKKDAQTIEFTVSLAPDEEKKVTYTAHYSW